MAGTRVTLRYSRTVALLAAAIITFVSLAGLFGTANMKPGVPTTALTNILGVLLSLGIVALVYDLILRGSVLHETLDIVGIKESVSSIGLSHIAQGGQPDWQELISNAEHISVLLANPLNWALNEWTHVLETAKRRRVDVDIYVPRADSDQVGSLASRLGFDQATFVPQLNDARSLLETSWRSEGATNLKKGSRFTLRSYEDIASYEMALFDDKAVIIVSDAFKRRLPVHTLVIQFSGSSGSTMYDWIRSQLAQLDATQGPEFSDEVR